jgi:hypothetical protein
MPAPPPPPACTPTPPVPFPEGTSTINGPVAPSIPLDPNDYGLTWPEAIQPTTGARCDGTNWLGTLTLLQGDFSEQVRLLPGMQEVTGPAGNTTKGNFCDQVRDLDKLSHSNSGAWYMVAAIQAHEDVHLTRFLPALRHEESAIEALFTALSVPDAPGLTPAAAAAAIRALPAFSTAVSDAQQLWLKEILVRVKGDHARGGPCDVAERGVVDPMIATICAHAKANAWGVCLRCRLRVP